MTEKALLEEMDNYTPVEAEEETTEADSAPTDVEIVTTDDGDYELVDQSGKVLISDEDVGGMGASDIISMYFTRRREVCDRRYRQHVIWMKTNCRSVVMCYLIWRAM